MSTTNGYQAARPGFFMRMFWKACGADRAILEKCDYREHVKYACLGGIVVATGLMAGLAGGYAFYTIFEPKGSALATGVDTNTLLISLCFGVVWGMMIFNLDRFIVTSTGQGDGSEKITREEFVGAIPRIVMGVIIAITISKPLEIRIFKSEIDVALEQEQLEKQSEFIDKIDDMYYPDIQLLEKKQEELKIAQKEKRERFVELENEKIIEITRSDRRGEGPIAESIQRQMDRLDEEIKVKELEQNSVDHELSAIRAEIEEKKENKELISNGLDGLLERIKLSHEIAGWVISLFITLLFVAIELTPIFFKLMLIKSPYDFLSDNQKELIKANAGIEIQYNFYDAGDGRERDLVIFHEATRQLNEEIKLTQAQKELNDYIISKWLEREKKKVDNDLDHYINISNGELSQRPG